VAPVDAADRQVPTRWQNAPVRRWILGARLRTLPAALVPVAVGTAVAAGAALVVSLALQVGTNFANDLSDGVRGADGPDRVGPQRLVGSGLATPAEVKLAVLLSFMVAALVGLTIAVAVSLWLLLVGAVSIAAGWFYTGGPRPYGYLGLGEVFVFTFFGLVATVGSAYLHQRQVTGLAVLAGAAVGLLACSLLVANNLRDIPTAVGSAHPCRWVGGGPGGPQGAGAHLGRGAGSGPGGDGTHATGGWADAGTGSGALGLSGRAGASGPRGGQELGDSTREPLLGDIGEAGA